MNSESIEIIQSINDAMEEIRRLQKQVKKLIFQLSGKDLMTLITHKTPARAVMIDVERKIIEVNGKADKTTSGLDKKIKYEKVFDSQKGNLAILKICPNSELGILLWDKPLGEDLLNGNCVVANSICISFMSHKTFFEVASYAIDKDFLSLNYQEVKETCNQNGIRKLFGINCCGLNKLFTNAKIYDVEVFDIEEFLDIADKYFDMNSFELDFLNFDKSPALNFREYIGFY